MYTYTYKTKPNNPSKNKETIEDIHNKKKQPKQPLN